MPDFFWLGNTNIGLVNQTLNIASLEIYLSANPHHIVFIPNRHRLAIVRWGISFVKRQKETDYYKSQASDHCVYTHPIKTHEYQTPDCQECYTNFID